jgi:hypothetical protein
MLYVPKVFISHSAKEPEARQLCQSVADHLAGAGFRVLWDADLQTSQPWRAVIDEWIWRCDTAVLVLSEAATMSRYVAYEAALLRQRWRNQFLLVPVWCPGVTEQMLIDRMGALQIAEIQTNVKLPSWPAAFDDVAGQVLAAVTPVLTSLQARHDVEERLISELNFGTVSEAALNAIAAKYGLPPFPAGTKQDVAATLTRRLLDSSEPLGEDRFSFLASGLGVMKTAVNDAARVPRIVNLVAPFCWVQPDTALGVTLLSTLPPGQSRAVAWARSWRFSERMYLYRGFCTRDRMKLLIASVSDTAGGQPAKIRDHIRSVLAWEVWRNRTETALRVAARITYLAKKGVPVFLLLPAHAVDAAVLKETQTQWPELCVFLFGDDEREIRERFPDVTILPLTPDLEDAARIGWGDCMAEADPKTDLEAETAFL